MKNIYSKNIGLLIVLGMITALYSSSCDSFVAVDLPNNQLTGVVVFQDPTTADAAMRNVYASLRDSGILTGSAFGLSYRLGCYADELDFYGSASNSTYDFYNNSLLPLNQAIKTYWNTTYNQVYAVNAVLEGITASTKIPKEDANRLKGEALFVRAFLHFYMVNLYGDVPYITTTDYQLNKSVSRKTTQEVYQLIISDLEAASTLLPENYYGSGRARPNKATVLALMARVYLYTEAWGEAANAASAVLNQTSLYTDEPDIKKVFLKGCKETIWQLTPNPEGKNTFEAASFTILAAPPANVALTESLVQSFSNTDLRKTAWIGSITNNTTRFYFAKKYSQYNPGSVSTEYSIIFRLAEIYLIRAEARAHQGETINALDDLNHVRQGAGLVPLNGLNQQQLLTAIMKERRWELFTEFGHRFFDLKRTGTLDAELEGSKLGWDSTDRLFPIPEDELSLNPNLLPQNTGY
ncbi:RagB/SusD family nutrient uptake outer membrane protein [Flavobacterium muglaense]|uniref:RagB/SusD family nutrient uptake outer membrane protein n=1 Tax=Flavobacterium muglaense TaxID=2764716 RepID=A0A923SII8_9FLAO|nr:RagB/SusD family nutrient uptake outer membrane protein [Flavobacterium muglaense]MBC5836707.1 RagB/SusD family nutrient uptake outer membrane protein [Flavobacterium muglaense]MBC5843343.1 RagB/SusD family nutrient uptake outer membrane protein [Flavobacterium muglaense]